MIPVSAMEACAFGDVVDFCGAAVVCLRIKHAGIALGSMSGTADLAKQHASFVLHKFSDNLHIILLACVLVYSCAANNFMLMLFKGRSNDSSIRFGSVCV